MLGNSEGDANPVRVSESENDVTSKRSAEDLVRELFSGSINLSVVWKHNKISRVELALHGSLFSDDSQIQGWLDAYLEKKELPFPYPLDLDHLTPFTQKVLRELKKIPLGSTATYGEIATRIGHNGAARAVGSACSKNPYPLIIPCHRVISQNGIGGFALDLQIKKKLLQFEKL
ncbi:MAG: Methylated-DNA--protein-cysteine methyltransferase [Chlamydiales bacterium]|nr:Methylated-DNA--protein-cysteine methyltransferase [Chlamydiales bacterium]MCH9636319.1 Methylated-DNA--protein-cysteine methyltransferase [Chlamydiales bacterium]MCH9703753.1 methylated-DNA--[protein]-cysteine S-methyltransferase [Chlamydiota bacterium]